MNVRLRIPSVKRQGRFRSIFITHSGILDAFLLREATGAPFFYRCKGRLSGWGGESDLNTSAHLPLLPDYRYREPSCLVLLPPCLHIMVGHVPVTLCAPQNPSFLKLHCSIFCSSRMRTVTDPPGVWLVLENLRMCFKVEFIVQG